MLMTPIHSWSDNSALLVKEMESYVHETLSADDDQRIDVNVFPMDKRIKIRECNVPLAIQSTKPIKAGHNNLVIRCSEPYWKFYANIQVNIYQRIWATSMPLRRNQTIEDQHITLIETEVSRYKHGYYTHKSDVLGLVVKRNIQGNKILEPKMLDQPHVIFKGDQVSIVSSLGSMAVKMKGTALENGRKNRQIRVENNSSGKVIKAYVKSPGRVEVPF
jgi:flagella basal body P-ring formation protein FlgA